MDDNVLREGAECDAHERQPIAMALVHVRLDLEHEAGELRGGGIEIEKLAVPAPRRPRTGRWRKLDQSPEERLDAKVVYSAAEEDRDQFAAEERGRIEGGARAVEELGGLGQFLPGVRPDRILEAGIIETGHHPEPNRAPLLRAL